MYTIQYKLDDEPVIDESFPTYIDITLRIHELSEEFVKRTKFVIVILGPSGELIQSASKL